MPSIIVCMSENRVIGKNNKMPWHLPQDLKHVKKLTTGHIILMGRKTFESIGKPLPNRRNVILTGNKAFQAEGCEVVHTLEEGLQLESEQQTLFIFGGSRIYKQFLPYVDTMYITMIHEQMDGDTFFPAFDEQAWVITSRQKGIRDEQNPYDYEFFTYHRKGLVFDS